MDIKTCFDINCKDPKRRKELLKCYRLFISQYITIDELKCLYSNEPFNCGLKNPIEISESIIKTSVENLPEQDPDQIDLNDLMRERCSEEEFSAEDLDFIRHVQKRLHLKK